jgi:hypothetical protein
MFLFNNKIASLSKTHKRIESDAGEIDYFASVLSDGRCQIKGNMVLSLEF